MLNALNISGRFFIFIGMKRVLNIVFLLGCLFAAKAQNESILPVDEHGKMIHYEVVDLKDVARDSLKVRLVAFLEQKGDPLKLKEIKGDTAFVATGKFVISKTVLVMSHPSGEILYQFNAEVREGKYRFWLTDFNFIPYQRDRYGNFVPSTTVGVPLESNPGKLNSGQWTAYQEQTASYAKDFAVKFKKHMASKIALSAPVAEKKVVDKKW